MSSNYLQRFHFFDAIFPRERYLKGMPLNAWYLKGLPTDILMNFLKLIILWMSRWGWSWGMGAIAGRRATARKLLLRAIAAGVKCLLARTGVGAHPLSVKNRVQCRAVTHSRCLSKPKIYKWSHLKLDNLPLLAPLSWYRMVLDYIWVRWDVGTVCSTHYGNWCVEK